MLVFITDVHFLIEMFWWTKTLKLVAKLNSTTYQQLEITVMKPLWLNLIVLGFTVGV